MRHVVFLLVVLGLGCGSHAEEHVAPPAPEAELPPPRTPAQRFDEAMFLLEAVPSTTAFTSGTPGAVTIRLVPKAGYHVNMEYPIMIDVTGPAELGIGKAHLERADAAAYEPAGFRYDCAVTPTAAGSREWRALVNFAVCTDQNCLQQEAPLLLPIQVN